MVGYKIGACRINNCKLGILKICPCLIQLDIPEDAVVIRPNDSNKLRCDKALVVEIRPIKFISKDGSYTHEDLSFYSIDYKDEINCAFSGFYSSKFKYKVGKLACADFLDTDFSRECTHGIHFFDTKEEALQFFLNCVISDYIRNLMKGAD